MRRTAATVAIGLALPVAATRPAPAHSAGGLDATDFDTRLTGPPPPPG